MRIVQMKSNGLLTNGLAELSHNMQDEIKETRDGVMGEGQALSEEGESQINKNDGGVTDVCEEVGHAVMEGSQQQPEGPLVCWERFLPLRSLKVLLVENDDSTRRVVSALLRNCGYEVVAATDGLQAWKLLEDLTNHFDLVLAEVVMPCLTGFGLLCKIVSHKTFRNIPVIMMSSHDSMSVVFKCLSKGAVDFLLKPIRRNELKNLWQHVWRKCHSASGSGSGSDSIIRTQKSTKSKRVDESGNDSSSNGEDDIGSIGLNLRDGSDNGSGTQNSWTKRAVEVDSPKSMSPWDQSADPPDSTCAQVIHSRAQACTNNWVPVMATKECEQQQNDKLDNHVMGKDLEIGVPRIPNLQLEDLSAKALTNMSSTNEEKFHETNVDNDGDKMVEGPLQLNGGKPTGELRNQASDLSGVITNNDDPKMGSTVPSMPNGVSTVAHTKNGLIYETKEMPSLELSLKRVRDVGDTGISAHDRNVLRHSGLSAFSRYNSASTANQAPTGNVGSCSPFNNSSEATKTESNQNFQSNSNNMPPNQHSNGSSNNDMGSTTNNAFTKAMAFTDKPAPKSTVKCRNPSSSVQPIQNAHAPPPQPTAHGEPGNEAADSILAQALPMNQKVQVQHHHHHYHHHHHHVHNMPHQQLANHDHLSLKNMAAAAPQCGLANKSITPFKGHADDNNLKGSASGSDHGSNGPNESSTTLNVRGTNMESDNGLAGKGGICSGTGIGSKTGIVQNGYALREAALNKFRQKRKERCFEKKVRYQSRKTLAEQRPRIRGQFVRQVTHDNEDKDAHS